jgi:hypothetical protein
VRATPRIEAQKPLGLATWPSPTIERAATLNTNVPKLSSLVSATRALKDVKIRLLDKVVDCTALFDTGSGVTALRRSFFEESFGAKWLALDKPLRLYWVNGEFIEVDKYAQVTIVVDDFKLPETVFVVDDFVEEVEVDGRRVRLPDLIIGSGTMDKYGIVLDPKEGVKLTGASLLL